MGGMRSDNPAMVVDPNGMVVLQFNNASNAEVWMATSKDAGASWSAPVRLAGQLGPVGAMDLGPGRGIALPPASAAGSARLMFAGYSHNGTTGKFKAGVWYSDDEAGGWSQWHPVVDPSGTFPGGSEPQLYLQPSGEPAIALRGNGLSPLRPFAWAVPGTRGARWSAAAHPVDLPTPNCQGSALRVSLPSERSGSPRDTLAMHSSHRNIDLFSNPSSSSGRVNMTVHASADGFHSLLPQALVISGGGAAYSCLTELRSDAAGLLWEGEADGCRGPSCAVYFSPVQLGTWSDAP